MSVETVEAPAAETAEPTQEAAATEETPAVEAKPVKAPKEPTKCLCALYGVEVPAEDGGEATIEEIGCTATTSSKFAPGHDAKLKSLLIKAGSLGRKVFKTDEQGNDVEISVADAAGEYGFADKVQSGIEIAQKKAADKAGRAEVAAQKKAEAAAKKEADKAAKAEAAATRKAEQLKKAEEKAAQVKADKEAKAAAAQAAKDAAAASAPADATPVAGSEDAPLF